MFNDDAEEWPIAEDATDDEFWKGIAKHTAEHITAARLAERRKAWREWAKWMQHTRGCDCRRNAQYRCTCGLDAERECMDDDWPDDGGPP